MQITPNIYWLGFRINHIVFKIKFINSLASLMLSEFTFLKFNKFGLKVSLLGDDGKMLVETPLLGKTPTIH